MILQTISAISFLWLLYKYVAARQVLNRISPINGGSILPFYPFSGVSTVLAPWFPRKGTLGSYFDLFNHYATAGVTCLASVEFWSSAPVFWVADAEACKLISTERTIFPKNTASSMYDALNIFGENIITVEGATWKRHRTVAKPAFNDANNAYVWQETVRYLRAWFSKLEKAPSGEIELVEAFTDITLGVICSAGFGQRSSETPGTGTSFEEVVASAVQLLIPKVLIPNWVYSFFARFYVPSLSPGILRIKETFDRLESDLMDLISQSGAWVTGGKSSTEMDAALLRNLVEANMNLDDQSAEKRQLTDRELLSDVFIFLAAGHETSSNTLAFAVAHLALYPDVQRKLYNEVVALWPDLNMQQTHDSYRECMNKLVYANAVFLETLRFFSPASRLDKKTTADTILKVRQFQMDAMSNGTKPLNVNEHVVAIPKGSYVIMDVFALHTNPIHWGQDVHEFKPERFIDTDSYRWPRDAFLGFALGSRKCIGERFAVTESLCILAHLVRQFEILVPEPLKSNSLEEQRRALLAWKPWTTTLPVNTKVILKKRS